MPRPVARRRRPAKPVEQLAAQDYWSLAEFAWLRAGCGESTLRRRLVDTATGQPPGKGCTSAVIALPDGVNVPCHRDLNSHWRISRWQYEAAQQAHQEVTA